ncbi:MAG: amino acid permease [bacterium]
MASRGTMGTFGGVFTPSILTILGLILFLRLALVVGQVGLGQALIIIVLANLISIFTSISLAAVATNLKVKGGGVYYIISRTLGLPFGGAIGLVLFLAQAISVGFYCVGFAESASGLLNMESGFGPQAIAAAAVLLTTGLAWIGADWATRIQYVVMVLIFAALASFALGAAGHWSSAQLWSNLGPSDGWGQFWVAFAIFFPAVTGFTQGVNMSGDLANPGKSIPRGTAYAVGLSFVIYILAAILCAAALPRGVLLNDSGAMKLASQWAPLIDFGIVAATLSSALASLLGAPRILQSLAKDRVFSVLQPFARGSGASGNPRLGVLLTGVIALAIVAIGNLNLIAAIVSMFFIVTYALLNYATYFEARGRSPSFRPNLPWYDPRISLAGAMGSIAVILAIDVTSGLAAVGVVFGIFQYLKRNSSAHRWADGQRSYHLQIVRENLMAAEARAEHPRDWRPQLLAFSADKESRGRLLQLANWIEGHSGLTTVVQILEGKSRHTRRLQEEAEDSMREEIRAAGTRAFPLVIASRDADQTVQTAIQAVGIGPTRINSLLVNWPSRKTSQENFPLRGKFAYNLHFAYSMGYNVLIFDSSEAKWAAAQGIPPEKRTIDVWWRDNQTGRLMLVLAYLLRRGEFWQSATIRVIAVAGESAGPKRQAQINAILAEVRIPAVVQIVPPTEDKIDQIVAVSSNASIVLEALAFRDRWFSDWLRNDLSELLPRLPMTLLVMAAEEFDLSADPDNGVESERAAAQDAVDDATRRHDAAVEALEDARKDLEKRMAGAADGTVGTEMLERLTQSITELEARLSAEAANLAAAFEIAELVGVTLKKPDESSAKP